MSTIRPLPGVRYATTRSRDISALLSPPYDIIDDRGKAELQARHPRNFVTVDLPHMPPKSAGPAHVYAACKTTLDQWLADGTLVRDAVPALYVYHQLYRHAGTAYVRKMFFARLRLEPFGEGSIFPHERTFGGPKEDRLALTKATQANLSPIFGLYEDARNEIAGRLEQQLSREPLAIGTAEGVENRLWAVTDAATIADVTRLIAPKPTYIADGHHRCGTGMLYRDWLISERGPLPPEHPANYVLCVFCAMEDPGLLILPTHRILPGVKVTPETFAGDKQVEVKPLKAAGPSAAIAALRDFGPQAVALYCAATQTYSVVRPMRPDILDTLEPERTPAWRRLGLAFLHAYLLDRVVTPKLCGGTASEIRYIKADDDAITVTNQTGGTGFLMQPTTMEELRAVCKAGDLMPQKSTYFYPKLASGLVINPLTE
ncbi:MAG: DUF1015 domain-containing protein [Phycisphaerae bacterium]|nr:DUF1015 domain-containing protein [Phycisphaerae bacterium]